MPMFVTMRFCRPTNVPSSMKPILKRCVISETADQQRLAAVLMPLDRPACEPRKDADQGLLGVAVHLQPESAADVRRDHTDLGLRNTQRL